MDHSSWLSFFSERTKSQEESDVWVFAAKQMSFSVFSAGVVVFHCPNKGVRALVQTKKTEILALLREYLHEEVRDVVFELKALKEDMGVKKPVAPTLFEYEPTIADIARQSGLNPRLTLENYAVSHCNNVAYAACQVVVTQVGSSYNPLFLWGGVGVGKTHLAQATAYRILQLHKNKRVYFCGGDKFTNEIIDAIRARTTDKFRQKYRRLDVLIVDDIQFIAGKQTVQQEFFHTFNDIIARGGQVILISDRPPQQIGDLEDRLRSRFAGGLIIDISPPDFELKTAIALIKAKERGIDVDIEFAKKIER
jgi:chromosomal replication initiator protein